jgi:hypothetical protein
MKFLELIVLIGFVQVTLACPSGYTHNPIEDTCLRLVKQTKSWYDAKADCERSGEYLLVLDGVDSANWFEHLRRTNSGEFERAHALRSLSYITGQTCV